jgi:hypothetical protein
MDVNSRLADNYYGYSYDDELEAAFNHWASFKSETDLIEYAQDFELDIFDSNGNIKDDWFQLLADYWIENHASTYDDWDYFDD